MEKIAQTLEHANGVGARGRVELVQGRDGEVTLLYAIPRRQVAQRSFYESFRRWRGV